MDRERMLRGLPVLLGLAGVAAVWTAGRAANPGPVGFPLDDAWIHMVYGRGLLSNGFLAYEDGIPSTGCTSPAWAIVLAVLHASFGRGADATPLVASVLLVGAALHAAGAGAAAGLARRAGADPVAAAVAGGIVGLAPLSGVAALSGMEVALTSLLLLAGTAAAASGRTVLAGFAFAGAGWARPESAAVLLAVAPFVVARAAPAERGREALRLFAAPVAAGAILVAYDLWAAGAPMPATFYAKGAASITDLPRRLGVALGAIVGTMPPFGFALGWLAVLGTPVAAARRRADVGAWIPLAAGAAYLVANVAVLDPKDPAAFYHQRYVLPSVPLLTVAAVLGARGWGSVLGVRGARLPLAALATAALAQAALSLPAASRHLHSDTRNINEVQRAIGRRLAATFPPGTRIAASDAGAIRYFSRLPTLDVLGLNTPPMLRPQDEYLAAHPVAALAFLPAWFRTPDGSSLEEMFRATTSAYTVTSNPAMGTMVVVRGRPDAVPCRARFGGFRSFAVEFASPGAARSANVRGAP